MLEDRDFQQRVQKIEGLVRGLEALEDPAARECALELFQLVMDIHGAGLERMLGIVFEMGEDGSRLIERFGRDELVSSLMLLYGLHPLSIEERVSMAIEKVGPYLRSQGGSVELLGMDQGAVRVRIEVSGNGGSTSSVRRTLESAIYDAAPDLVSLEIQGPVEHARPSGLVQLARSR